MTTDGGRSLPRRPARYGPDALEAHGGTLPGPAEITEVAHQTAAILVGTGRAAHDPDVTSRLVTIVDDLGAVHRRRPLVGPAGALAARSPVAALRAAGVGAAQPRAGQP